MTETKQKQIIPDVLIKKAAGMWADVLRKHNFDNGDETLAGAATAGLHGMLVEAHLKEMPDYLDRVKHFEELLIERLKLEAYVHVIFTRVDYDPCESLAVCSKEAGIPSSLFGCKTSIDITTDHLRVKLGYTGAVKNYFYLRPGEWLITDLYGSEDMAKIIKAVKAGQLDCLEVERVEHENQTL